MRVFTWPSLLSLGVLAGAVVLAMLLRNPSPAKNGEIGRIAISPTGGWLAAGVRDRHVAILSLHAKMPAGNIEVAGELNDLQFSPDGKLLAIADDDLRLVDVAALGSPVSPLRKDSRVYGAVQFNESASMIITINGQSEIELIDVRSRALVRRLCCSSLYGEIAFSGAADRDGAAIVSAGHWPRVWNSNAGSSKYLTPDRQDETFGPLVVDDKARLILMGSQDGRVYAWDSKRFDLLSRSPAQPEYVNTLAYLPRLQAVAFCTFRRPLRLWSLLSGSLQVLPSIVASSNLVALPDGKSILFGTAAGRIEQWELSGSPRRIASFAAWQ